MIDKRVMIAVTGASGSVYAERLVNFLVSQVERVYLVVSDAGRQVCELELGASSTIQRGLAGDLNSDEKKILRCFGASDLFCPIASGSSAPTDMVVVPASMGTLGRIAHGMSTNLIERSADVVLKEKKNFILVPRETPLNTIHIENMLKLSQMGVRLIPAMPAFYQKPNSIEDLVDFMVGRIIENLGIDHDLYRRWNSRMI